MPPIFATLFLISILCLIGFLVWKIFFPGNPCQKFPAHHLNLHIRKSYNMAFHPGDQKTLIVAADGDGLAADIAVVSSDPSVVSVTATADPARFTLDFLAVGTATLSATAANSEGNPIAGSLVVEDVAAAATLLTLTVE